MKNFFQSIGQTINLEQRIQYLKDTISSYTEYIIDLIVVFILQTIVIPLIVLWGLIRLFSHLLGVNIFEKIRPSLSRLMHRSKTSVKAT